MIAFGLEVLFPVRNIWNEFKSLICNAVKIRDWFQNVYFFRVCYAYQIDRLSCVKDSKFKPNQFFQVLDFGPD